MDRFIGKIKIQKSKEGRGLKSNMDRFIGGLLPIGKNSISCLKSNMDRFIDFNSIPGNVIY